MTPFQDGPVQEQRPPVSETADRADSFGPDKNRIAALLILALGCTFILATGLLSAPCEKLTPDAGVYLDIARSLARGEGFRLKINLNQDWIGPTRSAVPYQQPLVPLIFSFVAGGANSVRAANVMNTLFAVAALLGFFAAFRQILKPWKAAVALLPLAVSPAILIAVSAPLSEAFSLLLIAWGFYFLLRKTPLSGLAGLLFGLSTLARASNFFSVAGLVAVHGWALGRKDWKRSAEFAVLSLAPFLLLDVYGRIFFNIGYPGYGIPSKIFLITRNYGGAVYQAAEPSLQFGATIGSEILFKMLALNSSRHFLGIAGYVGWIFLIPAAAGFFLRLFPEERQTHRWPVAFALAQLFALVVIYHFLNTLEVDRYSLIPLALLPPVAFMTVEWFRPSLGYQKVRNTVMVAAVLFMCVRGGAETIGRVSEDRSQYLSPQIQKIYFEEPADWVRADVLSDELIATNYIMQAYRFDRPMISLPVIRQFTKKNLAYFILVHRPAALLIDRNNPNQPEWGLTSTSDILQKAGFLEKERNERFSLYLRAS